MFDFLASYSHRATVVNAVVCAAVALGNIGTDAKDAAVPLSQLLKDDDARLRVAATGAIRKITTPKPPSGP